MEQGGRYYFSVMRGWIGVGDIRAGHGATVGLVPAGARGAVYTGVRRAPQRTDTAMCSTYTNSDTAI